MEMISARMLRQRQDSPAAVMVSTSPEQVGKHISARTRGVEAAVAMQRTKAFFRSTGHRWSLALA